MKFLYEFQIRVKLAIGNPRFIIPLSLINYFKLELMKIFTSRIIDLTAIYKLSEVAGIVRTFVAYLKRKEQ